MGRRMCTLDPFLHSTPTPKPHMPYSSKQSRRSGVDKLGCTPKIVTLAVTLPEHLSILVQELIPI